MRTAARGAAPREPGPGTGARLLFATDLHGALGSFSALCELARAPECVALVLGGDLFARPDLRTRRPSAPQERFVRDALRPLLSELRAAKPELFVGGVLGNDDVLGTQDALEDLRQAGLWTPLHLERHRLPGDELWIAGYSCVPLTPFRLSDWDRPDRPGWRPERLPPAPLRSTASGRLVELSPEVLLAGPSIACELEDLAALGDPARTIYVVHGPPAGLGLDLMHGGRGIGSESLRAWIETHQPPLTLHGHVHESPRVGGRTHALCGATRCCNPGDSRSRLRALWIELDAPGAPPRPAVLSGSAPLRPQARWGD